MHSQCLLSMGKNIMLLCVLPLPTERQPGHLWVFGQLWIKLKASTGRLWGRNFHVMWLQVCDYKIIWQKLL